MNDVILKIAENLVGTSIGLVGLIFAALSILLSIGNDNWKIKRLKKSNQYKIFVKQTANLAIYFMVLFLLSIILLLINKLSIKDTIAFQYVLYFYLFLIFAITIETIRVVIKFKKLFILLLDNSKPDITE